MSGTFDPGLQPERSELAWRRTCLALGAGSLVALRLLPAAFGSAWWVLVGAAGLALSGVLWVWARRRYRTVNELLLRTGDRARLPGAGLLLTLGAVAASAGGVGVAVTLAMAQR